MLSSFVSSIAVVATFVVSVVAAHYRCRCIRCGRCFIIVVVIVFVFLKSCAEEKILTPFFQGPSVSKPEAYGGYARGRPGVAGGAVASVAAATSAAAAAGHVVDSFGKEGSAEADIPTKPASASIEASLESGTSGRTNLSDGVTDATAAAAAFMGEVELEAPPVVETAPPSQESLSNGITFHIPDEDDIVKRTAALISTVTIEDPKPTATTTTMTTNNDAGDDDDEEGAGSSV